MKDQTIHTNYDRNDVIRLKIIVIKYVTIDETIRILDQAHDSFYGGHFHAKALHTKLLKISYFWLTMEEDCKAHMNSYLEC